MKVSKFFNLSIESLRHKPVPEILNNQKKLQTLRCQPLRGDGERLNIFI